MHFRQPTLIERPLSGNFKCSWQKVAPVLDQCIPPYAVYFYHAPDRASVWTTFDIFGYYAVLSQKFELITFLTMSGCAAG